MIESVAKIEHEVSRSGVRGRFFAYSASVILVLVLIGFSKTFYLRHLFDVTDVLGQRQLVPHVFLHGVVLTAWFFSFAAQAWLVAVVWRRRGETHKRLMLFASLSILGPAFGGPVRPLGPFLSAILPDHFPVGPYPLTLGRIHSGSRGLRLSTGPKGR